MKELIQNLVYPEPALLIGLFGIIFLDLLTGIRKAANNGEATSSRGLRNSFDKATTYFSLIVAVLIVINCISLAHVKEDVTWLPYGVNGLLMACIYVELKSILENLIEINSIDKIPNDFATIILIPIHNIIILKLKKKTDENIS